MENFDFYPEFYFRFEHGKNIIIIIKFFIIYVLVQQPEG